MAVLLLFGGVIGGAYLLYDELYGAADYADYEGTGAADVVVKVDEGATGAQIATELRRLDVVQSVQAFTVAAAEEPRIRSVQPGYYRLRQHMSGEAAVALLLDPASRVGQLEIRGGVQLDDTRNPDGSTVPGVLSLISQSTCAELNGQQRCVTADELREAMSTARSRGPRRPGLGPGRRGPGRTAPAARGPVRPGTLRRAARRARARRRCAGCSRHRSPGWRPRVWSATHPPPATPPTTC